MASNSNQYIRLSVPRPSGEDDADYFFHLTFAQIVNAHEPALVGYKYERGIDICDLDSPVWIKRKMGLGTWKDYRICTQHLSDPIESILRAIASVRTPTREQVEADHFSTFYESHSLDD